MRRATEADLPAIRGFLSSRASRAMFPLSNLARFGLDGDHDYAPSMWIAGQGSAVCDVIAGGRAGAVMPVLARTDPAGSGAVLRDGGIAGLIGPSGEVRPLLDGLGLAACPTMLGRDEPHSDLDPTDPTIPAGAGSRMPLEAADPDEMIRWRANDHVEALGMPREKAEVEAANSYRSDVAAESHRVLMAEGRPLAATGFNAFLPDSVQIGGVYTPPALRSRGHARRAVALHLAEARARGVRRATLFSGSDTASRAYRAIGFRQIGQWTLVLLDGQPVVP